MKTRLIALCAIALSNVVFGQQKVNVPANIREDFAKKYPNATKVNWEQEDGRYGSSFYLGKIDMSVEYGTDGKITATETRLTFNELPPTAQEYMKKIKGRIGEIGRIELDSGMILYEVELKHEDIIFDAQGNFIEERVPKDG